MHTIIDELECFIDDELSGSKNYINKALHYKYSDKEFGDYMHKYSEEEMKHATSHIDMWNKHILLMEPAWQEKYKELNEYKASEFTKCLNNTSMKMIVYRS